MLGFCELAYVCYYWLSFIFTKYVFLSLPGLTLDGSMAPFLFLFGVLLWTFEEYVIHRWLFHMKPPANFPSLIWVHFLLHGQHHKVWYDRQGKIYCN